MKNSILFVSLAIAMGSATVAHAAPAGCLVKVSTAAELRSAPHNNKPESDISAAVSKAKVRINGKMLTYILTVSTELNDGGSSADFADEVYEVKAQGTETVCKVLTVKQLK